MTHDLSAAAMQRYHDRFDNDGYNAIGEFIASSLNADRDDKRVVALLVAVQNAALEFCQHPDHSGAWHTLAVMCGRNFLSFHTVDAMRDFLRPFDPDDVRIDDFEATAKTMLQAYSGLEDMKSVTAHANGIHSWQGRMAYDLLAVVEYLTHTAITLLAHEDETYTHEKLNAAFNRITGALYEGVRRSAMTSGSMRGGRGFTLDLCRQNRRKPCRCQRSSVSGLTMSKDAFQVRIRPARTTNNPLSQAFNTGRFV